MLNNYIQQVYNAYENNTDFPLDVTCETRVILYFQKKKNSKRFYSHEISSNIRQNYTVDSSVTQIFTLFYRYLNRPTQELLYFIAAGLTYYVLYFFDEKYEIYKFRTVFNNVNYLVRWLVNVYLSNISRIFLNFFLFFVPPPSVLTIA